MSRTEQALPPFGPSAPAAVLTQAERKRSGHIFQDCVARELEPTKKGTKLQGCEPCLARWKAHSAEAGRQQAAFDTAWYAAHADADDATWARGPQPTVTGRFEVPRETGVVAPRPVATTAPGRTNKFASPCSLCGVRIPEGAGSLAKAADGRWVVQHPDGCPEAVLGPQAAPPATEPGVYRRADGRVVRVQISRTSKKPYAVLCTDVKGGQDEYLGSGRHLEDLTRLTLAEATAYGRATVRCCVCGIELENSESRAAGIGPICASKGF